MEKKKNVIYGILLVVLAGVVLAYLYRLQLPYAIVLMLTEAAVLPLWTREKRKREQEQKRFAEVNLYIEQILYSFRKSQKVLSSLLDVEKLFTKGKMAECVKSAIAYIRETYDGEQITEKALGIIEAEYPARRMTYVHRLMLKVERLGGNCEDSIRILLKNRDMWEKETISYQKRCQVQKRNITVAIVLSACMCLMTPVLCQTALQEVNIMDTVIYQITTFILLISALWIYLYTEKYFSRDWLQEKNDSDAKSSLQKYEKVMHYNFGKARKKSFIWAAFMAGIMVLFAVWEKWFLAAICSPLVILFLFQHRIDYALAKKAVIHEIRKAFPDWLMEVSLLLQTENVAISIQKSIEYAPEILKPELRLLIEKLEVTPESNLPYSEFLQEFAIPEVSSAMGMLYSISDGGGSDSSVQIEEILTRNTQWQGEAEALSNQDKIGKMYLLFLLPALLGALKMVVDMTLILLAFFTGIHA